MSKSKNIVLVHGAWADGSSWSEVIPKLAAKGLNVTAVQLSLTSLADDAATVKRAIALEDGPVLLVGHSYGGAVITEAGGDPKATGLVYVAAFAPDAGESAGALLATVPPAPLATEGRPDADGFVKLTKAGIYDDFAQDLSDVEKAILFAAQAPTSVNLSAETSRRRRGNQNPPGTSWRRTTAPSRIALKRRWQKGSAPRRSPSLRATWLCCRIPMKSPT